MASKSWAFEEGWGKGYSAAIYCEVSDEDRREAGCDCGEFTICDECLTKAAYDSEQNARSFSPWEFIAHDINESDDSEELWEDYDNGVTSGIADGAKERLSACPSA